MASMSFSETTPEAAPEQERDKAEVSLAIAAKPSAPVAVYVEGEDAEGEFTARDFQRPSLNLVTKTSANVDVFGIGTWVVGKEVAVGKMSEPLNVVALKIQKAYQEQLPFGAGRPRMFRTAEEVTAAGLSLQYEAEAKAAEVLGVRFWLPQPKDVDAPHIFTLESPEGYGAVVKFFAARTAYTSVGKPLIDACRAFLSPSKGGIVAKWWELSAMKKVNGANSWLLPLIKPGKPTSPEMAAFLKSIGV